MGSVFEVLRFGLGIVGWDGCDSGEEYFGLGE